MKAPIYLSLTSEYVSANDRLATNDEAVIMLENWIHDAWLASSGDVDGTRDESRRYVRMLRIHKKLKALP